MRLAVDNGNSNGDGNRDENTTCYVKLKLLHGEANRSLKQRSVVEAECYAPDDCAQVATPNDQIGMFDGNHEVPAQLAE